MKTQRGAGIILLSLLALVLVIRPNNFVGAQQETSWVFVENVGQFPGEQTRFQASLGSTTLRLSGDALWFTIIDSPQIDPRTENDSRQLEIPARQGVNLKLSFSDANPQPHLEPFNPLNTRVSYLTGRDPANWQTDVPVWGGVRYVNLYPGVDLEITSENGQLVQQLVVRERAAVAAQSGVAKNGGPLQQVQWQIDGADEVSVEGNQLRLSTALGDITLPLWQVVSEDKLPLELSAAQTGVDGFAVTAPFASPSFATEIGDTQSLMTAGASDLLFSTFLGSEGNFDHGLAITYDAEGYVYVTGQADDNFPTTPGAFDTSLDGVFNDVFVTKLTPDGSQMVFSTYIGGSDWETSRGIHVDEAGDITISGGTTSLDFPTTPGAFDDTMAGVSDIYVAKLNSTGTDLIYSTLIGGNQDDFNTDLAVDQAGYAYLTGSASAGFPTTPGVLKDTVEGTDAFVVKVALDGTDLLYATLLGGTERETGHGIAVDAAGYVYVAGQTASEDFPVTPGAFDSSYSRSEGFVAKLTADGAALVYATYLGGDEVDSIEAIDIDTAGYVYATGLTHSSDFPTTPDAFGPICTECTSDYSAHDSFVTKLNPDGADLAYSTFLGGNLADYSRDIAVSENGRAYVTGYTFSPDFPITPGAFDTVCEGCDETYARADVFVSRVNPTGTTLEYGTFIGGNSGMAAELARAMAADNNGNVYVIGSTNSEDFPITGGVVDSIHEGYYDVFVFKLATGSDDPEPEPTPTPGPSPVPDHTCGPTPLGEITVDDAPRGIDVDPARNRVYVAHSSHSVSVIDTTTNTVQQTIALEGPVDVAYDPTNNIIWASSFNLDQVIPIQANEDATGFTVLPGIEVGNGPWGVAYNPANNAVYVVNNLSESVSVVDASTKTVSDTLTEPFHAPWHLAVNSITGKVYVANSGHNSVTVINGTEAGSEVQLWDSGAAYGIAVDETRDTVYVATVHSHRIVAIGWLNDQPDQFLGWASFQRGYNPNRAIPLRAIAVNPARGPAFDGGHLWATTSTGDGSEVNQALFIPKGWSSRFHVPLPQSLGEQPTEGIAVDRVNNRVYFSSGTTPGTVTVIGDHDSVCGGIAPASVADESDEIGLDVYSVAEVIRSDVTEDGIIDIFDLVYVAARYDSADTTADLNEDGTVDIFDLVIVANHYDQRVPGAGQ